MTCLGCQLSNGQINTHIVYENEWLTCFLDHNPYNEGHILLLPKQHRAELSECSQEEVLAIFDAIRLISSVLDATFNPDGITVLQNGGIFNELTHVHIHIVPRYKGQNFAEFYIDNDEDVAKHAPNLLHTKKKLIEAINRLK